LRPKAPDLAEGGEILVEMHGLGHVAIGVAVVGLKDVALMARTAEDHHWYGGESRVRFDALQEVVPAEPGQVEIQQDEVRKRVRLEMAQCGATIPDDVDFRARGDLTEGLANQDSISGVIFDNENTSR
jgi:hypothetical protein